MLRVVDRRGEMNCVERSENDLSQSRYVKPVPSGHERRHESGASFTLADEPIAFSASFRQAPPGRQRELPSFSFDHA